MRGVPEVDGKTIVLSTVLQRSPLAWLKRVLYGTRRLSIDMLNGLPRSSNHADAPQAHGCEERRADHSQRRRQPDLQDKHRLSLWKCRLIQSRQGTPGRPSQ